MSKIRSSKELLPDLNQSLKERTTTLACSWSSSLLRIVVVVVVGGVDGAVAAVASELEKKGVVVVVRMRKEVGMGERKALVLVMHLRVSILNHRAQ